MITPHLGTLDGGDGWMDGCVEGLGDTKVMHVCHVWKVGKLTVKR